MGLSINIQGRTTKIEDNLIADNEPHDFSLEDAAILKFYFPFVEHLVKKLWIDTAQFLADHITGNLIDSLTQCLFGKVVLFRFDFDFHLPDKGVVANCQLIFQLR